MEGYVISLIFSRQSAAFQHDIYINGPNKIAFNSTDRYMHLNKRWTYKHYISRHISSIFLSNNPKLVKIESTIGIELFTDYILKARKQGAV